MMSKKILASALIAILISAGTATAQIDLQPFVGWHIGGKARFAQGDLNVKSDMNYGLALDVAIQPGIMVELYYSQMNTTADWFPLPGFGGLLPATRIGMDVHYLQVGGMRYITRGKIEPFGGLTLGATWFKGYENEDRSGNTDSVTRFAITLGGGVKIMASERIGIRLQARLLMPMYFAGVGLWAGTGGGGLSVNSWVPIVQGDFTGGLVFRLQGPSSE